MLQATEVTLAIEFNLFTMSDVDMVEEIIWKPLKF